MGASQPASQIIHLQTSPQMLGPMFVSSTQTAASLTASFIRSFDDLSSNEFAPILDEKQEVARWSERSDIVPLAGLDVVLRQSCRGGADDKHMSTSSMLGVQKRLRVKTHLITATSVMPNCRPETSERRPAAHIPAHTPASHSMLSTSPGRTETLARGAGTIGFVSNQSKHMGKRHGSEVCYMIEAD